MDRFRFLWYILVIRSYCFYPLSLFPEPVWTSGKRFLTVRRHKVQSDGRTDGRTDGQSARERERDRDPLFLDDSTNGTERNAWQRERERERETERERPCLSSIESILFHRFCDQTELNALTRELIDNRGKNLLLDKTIGYLLQVDLEYEEHMMDFLSIFPPLAEKRIVNPSEYSPYMKEIAKQYQFKGSTTPKLITDLRKKSRFTIYYRNLIFLLENGFIKLTAIHMASIFKQRPWLSEFVQFNTTRRAAATTTFEKSLYKLVLNALYGKMLENVRSYTRMDLCLSKFAFQRRISRINYHSCQILNEDVAIVRSTPLHATLDKANFVGIAILALSKLHMLKFFYTKLMTAFHNPPEKILRLHTSDTDSYVYSVLYHQSSTSTYLEDLTSIIDCLDLSAYPESHPIYDLNKDDPNFRHKMTKNRGVLGMFKGTDSANERPQRERERERERELNG